MDFEIIEGHPKSYYLHLQATTVVGIRTESGKENFISLIWFSQLSFDPPLMGILVAPKRYSHDLLVISKGFSMNFLDYSKVDLIEWIGTTSGKDVDKVEYIKKNFSENILYSKHLGQPIIGGAYLAVECKKISQVPYGDHTLFVGEILTTYYKKDYFDENTVPDNIKATIYVGGGRYITLDWSSFVNKRG